MDNSMTYKWESGTIKPDFDFTAAESALQEQIDLLSNHADKYDYSLAVTSGLLCGVLDVFWVGKFDLHEGKKIADDQMQECIKKAAKAFGCDKDDIKSALEFLEKKFKIPSDGNTPDFGGGLQHHLRDFAHHPTVAGLFFSLLTQFTGFSYGTDVTGKFMMCPVPEKSRIFIGKNVPEKIFKGTIIWFFHLLSDVAGSSGTIGNVGGTGIPGPILALAKELSTLPVWGNSGENTSLFLSKLFNGTFFAQHDSAGNIIQGTEFRFDLRAEIGIGIELGKQALPVIANECVVRAFYSIRQFYNELKNSNATSFEEVCNLDWKRIVPFNNPTLTRMLVVSTGVFTAVDVVDAVAEQNVLTLNFIGIGRFAIALSAETINLLKVRNVKEIQKSYQLIENNTYRCKNALKSMSLTVEQVEILYNLEYLKTEHDVELTKQSLICNKNIYILKSQWLDEWKKFISLGFSKFVDQPDAVITWYSEQQLLEKISYMTPDDNWFKLVLLEATVFYPYFPLELKENKKGMTVPDKKYDALKIDINRFSKDEGDKYLDSLFAQEVFYKQNSVAEFRKSYVKMDNYITDKTGKIAKKAVVAVGFSIVMMVVANAFAPAIAVALVGSQFAGLNGAALTSASLAYLGGGAIASGGMGMAGGTMVIAGGGAVLGAGIGTGVDSTANAIGDINRVNTQNNLIKILVSLEEIFCDDKEYLNDVSEQLERYKNALAYECEELMVDKKKNAKRIKELNEIIAVYRKAIKAIDKIA